MNETTGVASCLPCICGHGEDEHTWYAKNHTGLCVTGRCAFVKRLPRNDNSATIGFTACHCAQYEPDLARTL